MMASTWARRRWPLTSGNSLESKDGTVSLTLLFTYCYREALMWAQCSYWALEFAYGKHDSSGGGAFDLWA